MRISILVGIVLIVAGALVLFLGGSFTSHREVVHAIGLTVSADQQHTIRPWVAGVAVLAGVVFVGMGVRRRA